MIAEKTYMGGRTRQVIREYSFLHQFSVTADIALQASSERRATVMFLEIARNALYPTMTPTQIYKRLRFRWRRYCEIRKLHGLESVLLSKEEIEEKEEMLSEAVAS